LANFGLLTWTLILLLFGTMSTSSWYLGVLCSQSLLRLGSRNKRDLFERWGATEDLFRPSGLFWLVLQIIATTVVSLYLFFWSWIALAFAVGEHTSSISVLFSTLYVVTFAFTVGLWWEIQRSTNILTMVTKLEGLNEDLRRYFTVGEILSMYELMRNAPAKIWEQHSGLTAYDINDETHEKYRRMAEPFRHRQTVGHNRTVVRLTIFGLAIAAIGVAAAIWSALD